MNKEELFEKYFIDESHNLWEGIDDWNSVEIYRITHNGNLPPHDDDSVAWVLEYLDKLDLRTMSNHESINWGSRYLTGKRMVRTMFPQILKELNSNTPLPTKNVDCIGYDILGNPHYVFRCNCNNDQCFDWRCSVTGSHVNCDIVYWEYLIK